MIAASSALDHVEAVAGGGHQRQHRRFLRLGIWYPGLRQLQQRDGRADLLVSGHLGFDQLGEGCQVAPERAQNFDGHEDDVAHRLTA